MKNNSSNIVRDESFIRIDPMENGFFSIIKRIECLSKKSFSGECNSRLDAFLKRISNYIEQRTDKKNSDSLNPFFAPRYEPALRNDKELVFEERQLSAHGKHIEYWDKILYSINQSSEEAIKLSVGSLLQWDLYLLFLLNSSEKEYRSLTKAVKLIFDDSTAIHGYKTGIRKTGRKGMFGICDLANCLKIVRDKKKKIYAVGGCCFDRGEQNPIGNLIEIHGTEEFYWLTVPWIVGTR